MGTACVPVHRSIRPASLAAALACLVGSAASTRAQLIADSAADFSGNQGGGGWHYGYYEGTFTPAAFQAFPLFGQSATLWSGNTMWYRHGTAYWTLIGSSMTHTNGLRACGTRTPSINWTVRRWVSTIDGPVRVNIHVENALGTCGDGIGVHVFHNSDNVLATTVNASGTLTQDIPLCLREGDWIDFTTDPGVSGNECCDEFSFEIEIHHAEDPDCVPCRADFDHDGFLTGLDFDAYTTAFQMGDLSADFDGDGFNTGLDFDAYVQAFEMGC